MGWWGHGPMDGDSPMDFRGRLARVLANQLNGALSQPDDGDVFAAAHLLLELLRNDDVLGIDYHAFRVPAPLVRFAWQRVRDVKLAEEWANDEKREQVRMELLQRLLTLIRSNKPINVGDRVALESDPDGPTALVTEIRGEDLLVRGFSCEKGSLIGKVDVVKVEAD